MSPEIIAVDCPGCGRGNELGRVFCIGCGKRLPSNGIDAGRIRQAGEASSRRMLRHRAIQRVVCALLALLLMLFFWPRGFWPGPEGDIGAARRFQRSMSSFVVALEKVDSGIEDLRQTFLEDEINAYLRQGVLRDTPDREGRVRITPHGIVFRWRLQLWNLAAGPLTWRPMLSMETTYIRHNGGWVARGARVGHLPLPGPLGAPVRALLTTSLTRRDEWKTLRRLRVESLENGAITLSLQASDGS